MAQRIQLRRGTAAEWTAANPVLANGEPGVEKDTGKLKLGDGVTAWTGLAYASKGDQGIPGVADDASVKELIEDPTSETATVLSATYVRFVDQNGDPLPAGSVTTIHVNTATGDIDDITFEEV